MCFLFPTLVNIVHFHPSIDMEWLDVEIPKGDNTFGMVSCLTIKKCTKPLTSINLIL